MITYTLTFTEHNCTVIRSGLTKEFADKQKALLTKQNIACTVTPHKRITGNLK